MKKLNKKYLTKFATYILILTFQQLTTPQSAFASLQVDDMILDDAFSNSSTHDAHLIPVPSRGDTFDVIPWTQGVLPIEFDSDISADRRERFMSVCAEWGSTANIYCVPRTNQTTYVFVTGRDKSGACRSAIGMSGTGPQTMYMGKTTCWFRTTIAHEMGHMLGFMHKHQRPDRDQYIQVNSENISSGPESAFSKMIWASSELRQSYDFASIMHYSAIDLLHPFRPIFSARPGYESHQWELNVVLRTISAGDHAAARALYGARSFPVPSGTAPAPNGYSDRFVWQWYAIFGGRSGFDDVRRDREIGLLTSEEYGILKLLIRSLRLHAPAGYSTRFYDQWEAIYEGRNGFEDVKRDRLEDRITDAEYSLLKLLIRAMNLGAPIGNSVRFYDQWQAVTEGRNSTDDVVRDYNERRLTYPEYLLLMQLVAKQLDIKADSMGAPKGYSNHFYNQWAAISARNISSNEVVLDYVLKRITTAEYSLLMQLLATQPNSRAQAMIAPKGYSTRFSQQWEAVKSRRNSTVDVVRDYSEKRISYNEYYLLMLLISNL